MARLGGTPANSLGGDVIVVASTMIEWIVRGAQGMHERAAFVASRNLIDILTAKLEGQTYLPSRHTILYPASLISFLSTARIKVSVDYRLRWTPIEIFLFFISMRHT